MAAELRIRPEWLSKICNGHEPASYNVGLRFADFLRRRGIEPAALARAEPVRPADGEEAALRAAILAQINELVATSDTTRLRQILSGVGSIRSKCAKRQPSGPKAARAPAPLDRTEVLRDRFRILRREKPD